MPKYRSKLEQTTADLLKKNGIKFKYETTKLKFVAPVVGGICGTCGELKGIGKRRTYLADFTLADGSIVEAKGILSSSERTKFLAIRASNAGVKITFVFGADNKLSRSSKSRYSDWCNDNDFEFGIKALPPSLRKTVES